MSKTLLRHTLIKKIFLTFLLKPYLYTFSLCENPSFIIFSAETDYISTRSWYRNINFLRDRIRRIFLYKVAYNKINPDYPCPMNQWIVYLFLPQLWVFSSRLLLWMAKENLTYVTLPFSLEGSYVQYFITWWGLFRRRVVCPRLDICVFVLIKSEFMLYQIRVVLPLWIVIVRIGSCNWYIIFILRRRIYTVIKNKPLYRYIGTCIFKQSRHFLLHATTISKDSRL